MVGLKNKVVLITGASRGIGRAIAHRLSGEGAKLALCGRDAGLLEKVKIEAEAMGAAEVFTRGFDLRFEDEILQFYRESRERLGPLDVLVNNAGYNESKAALWEVKTDIFDNMMAVNMRAPFLFMREAFRDMKERKSGHVVNILSTVCLFDNENMSVYTAAKKGLQGLTDVFRKEARPFNIRVSSIYPGGVDTDFRVRARPDYMKPKSVAEAVYHVITAPDDLVFHHVTFRPQVETNF